MELTKKTSEEIFAELVVKEGLPREQVDRFLSFRYTPLPWQLRFHSAARTADKTGGPVDIGCGGARGPGKSHAVFAQVALDDCQRFPGLKFLFLRQTGKAASESFEDLIYRVLSRKVDYKYSKGSTLIFPNGSRIILGGFETENDIDKYIGIEYDGMAVEEINQLTKDKIDKLKGSLRTSRTDGWRPRMYTSFNPGGIGHVFVKEHYVTPFREKTEVKTRFIPSTYKDNPHLNVEYREYLEGLSSDLGKKWREGNFDIAEGQFFDEWNFEVHVEEPFHIPDSWVKLRSIDVSGKNGWTACGWYAVDYDGRVHRYREYYQTGRDNEEHAKEIARLSEGEEYKYTTIDTAAFAKLGMPETTAEVYERNGVNGLIPSMKNRVMGWDLMHQYLRWKKKDPDTGIALIEQPKFKVFSTCKNFIRTIPMLVHDEKNPDDIDTNGEDHIADECRYVLQTLRQEKVQKPLSSIERRLKELKEREEDESYLYRKNIWN